MSPNPELRLGDGEGRPGLRPWRQRAVPSSGLCPLLWAGAGRRRHRASLGSSWPGGGAHSKRTAEGSLHGHHTNLAKGPSRRCEQKDPGSHRHLCSESRCRRPRPLHTRARGCALRHAAQRSGSATRRCPAAEQGVETGLKGEGRAGRSSTPPKRRDFRI